MKKALTIIQPYADAFLDGKTIETRSWKTNFRGVVFIHAGKGKRKSFYIPESKVKGNRLKGCVIAAAELVDCILITKEFIKTLSPREKELGFYKPGRYAWIFRNVRPVKPVHVRGALGLWNLPESVTP